MDFLVRQEIYIPEDAEVKSIPLRSLPNSVLKRMGFSVSHSEGSRRLTDSAVGVWICPAVLRPKGQKRASDQGNSQLDNMSSKIAKEFRGSPGPFQVSFVSSNKAAHKVLNETLHGANVTADTSSPSVLPPGLAPQTYQVAVIIYQGRIYLSIRKPSRSKCQGETKDPQPASKPAKPAIPSTSDTSSNSQKKPVAPQASLKPADKQPQKKRLRISLIPRSKLPRNPVKKPAATTEQELLNSHKADRNLSHSKEAHSEHRKDVTHNRREGSSSLTAPSVPHSTDGAHKPDSLDAGDKQHAEDTADRFQPETNSDRGTQEPGGDDAQSSNQNDDMDVDMAMFSHSWSCRESQSISSTLLQECDFKELAQEEKIALAKARLRQSEAALNNLNSLK